MKIPESETIIEMHLELTDPVRWAAHMLTKPMPPGITVGEAQDIVDAIIRKAMALSRWIPVQTEMPDDDITVLVALSDGDVESGYHSDDKWFSSETGMDHVISVRSHRRVTHWMHLPEAPK